VRWPPQTAIAYVMHDSIRAVNTVCSCFGAKPWLLNSLTGIYVENWQSTQDSPHVPLLPLSFTPKSITVIHSIIDSLSLKLSIIPSQADSELSCSYCRQSSQVLSYQSHLTLSPLALNNWTHRIQASVTYVQSSHNHPTSIHTVVISSPFNVL